MAITSSACAFYTDSKNRTLGMKRLSMPSCKITRLCFLFFLLSFSFSFSFCFAYLQNDLLVGGSQMPKTDTLVELFLLNFLYNTFNQFPASV